MSQQAIGMRSERRRPVVDRRVFKFLRHLGEMTLAMMIGMATLGWALRGAIEMISAGALRNVEVSVLAMALSMSIPMIIWMRHRGHAWVSTLEMSAGMIVPAVALLAALRMDAMLGSTALALQHGLMMPTMIGVMLWRHSEYLH